MITDTRGLSGITAVVTSSVGSVLALSCVAAKGDDHVLRTVRGEALRVGQQVAVNPDTRGDERPVQSPRLEEANPEGHRVQRLGCVCRVGELAQPPQVAGAWQDVELATDQAGMPVVREVGVQRRQLSL